MPRHKIEDGTDDTEGNVIRGKAVADGVEDDTEGNAARGHFVEDGVDTDDTEGNAFRRS